MLLKALDGRFGDAADALSVDGVSCSREQLRAAAGGLAARIGGASALAVLARPTLETVVAVTAGLLAGVPVVPVPPDAGPKERAHILRDSGAPLFAVAERDADTASYGSEPVPISWTGSAGRGCAAAGSDPAGAPAFILYTSGTTGAPKGVQLSARAVAAGLDALADAWAWTPDDTLVHGLPLFHVHGLILGVLGPLRTGGRLVHTGRPTPSAYAAAGGSLYFGVPTVWSRVAADEPSAKALAPARLLVSGSAPLPVPVFDRLKELTGQAPIERYGMTETLITLSTRADGERRPGSVGLPLAGVRTRLVAEDGSPAPHDGETVGELQVDGPTLCDGYLGRPDADAEARTADGWFRTGDVAVIDPDGFHRIVGRASVDLIKSGGYRIGAGEVEAALRDHPSVADAAVVGVPDADLGQVVVAYVIPAGDGADGAQVTGDQLTAFVAGRLSVHKRPRRVVLVDELPRNAMGKVLKKQLLELDKRGR